MTMNLTRSMAGSERRPVASTRKMGVIHEVAEDGAVPGPFVRLAERKDPGLPGDGERVAVGVPDAAQGIGGGGGIAAGDVDVPPVGGGDEPAVGAS